MMACGLLAVNVDWKSEKVESGRLVRQGHGYQATWCQRGLKGRLIPTGNRLSTDVVEGVGDFFRECEQLVVFGFVFHELGTDFNAANQFFGYFYGNLNRDGFHRFLFTQSASGACVRLNPLGQHMRDGNGFSTHQ